MSGGLVLSSTPDGYRTSRRPLSRQDEFSWIPHVRAGDDQGSVGTCTLFSMAEWCEVMYGALISNEARTAAYKGAIGDGRDAGLTHPAAFDAAKRAGWFRSNVKRIVLTDDPEILAWQPLICGLKVTKALTNINRAGCCDHEADNDEVLGYHSMLRVAVGRITAVSDEEFVYYKNWWKESWGTKGMCVMSDKLNSELCLEMWRVEYH